MYLNEASGIESIKMFALDYQIKQNKVHSGVEATPTITSSPKGIGPAVASVGLPDSLAHFGNLVSFTWLNGTTTYVDNSGGTLTEPTSTFKAIDKYTFEFVIGPSIEPYAFTGLDDGISCFQNITSRRSFCDGTQIFRYWLASPYTFGILRNTVARALYRMAIRNRPMHPRAISQEITAAN
jgi:hypothetical protein